MKTLALFITLLLSINTISAQQRGGGQRVSIEERQEKELAILKEHLNLDKAQEKKIIELQKNFKNEVNTLRSETSQKSERGEMRQNINALRQKYNKALEQVLTEEQNAKYKEYLENRDDQMGQRQDNRQKQGKGQREGNREGNRGNGGNQSNRF